MKIAFIRKRYTPYGGAERYTASLIKYLTDKGHEIHIFANSWDSNHHSDAVYHYIPIIKGASFLKVLSFAFFTKRIIKKYRFDIIHSFERTLCQDIYRAGDGCHKEWLIQKKKAASFLENLVTFINPLNFTILAIEDIIFKKANYKLIIANSKRGKEEIIKHYNVPGDKIEVVYNGVDLSEYNPANKRLFRDDVRLTMDIGKKDILILFTGSGFKRKGLKYLLYAMALLADKKGNMPVRLLVAGHGNLLKYMMITKRLGIKDYVKFIGPYPYMKKFYAAADIFVLPSLYEPFSNACCEAMASGLSVITSKISGVSELIQEGENGFILNDPTDAGEITDKICVLFNSEERIRIGNNARETIERYDMESQVTRITEIYERIL